MVLIWTLLITLSIYYHHFNGSDTCHQWNAITRHTRGIMKLWVISKKWRRRMAFWASTGRFNWAPCNHHHSSSASAAPPPTADTTANITNKRHSDTEEKKLKSQDSGSGTPLNLALYTQLLRTFREAYAPCIYSHARSVTAGNSGFCSRVCLSAN